MNKILSNFIIKFPSIYLHQPVTPICQRSDDQSGGIPKVLVPVHVVRGDHLHGDLLILPVVPQLRYPIEIETIGDSQLHQFRYHVSR